MCATFLHSALGLAVSATQGFAYDHLGNRYQEAATHNSNNQYTHIHGEYVWGLTEDAYPELDPLREWEAILVAIWRSSILQTVFK